MVPYRLRLAVLLSAQLSLAACSQSGRPTDGRGPREPAREGSVLGEARSSGAIGARHDFADDLGPSPDGATGSFALDAAPAELAWNPKTISVVLPCAEEREYALKTVQAVHASTPPAVLREVLVVDDGSQPPLAETYLPLDVQERYAARVLRHERTVGLIRAKQTGGDAATGDVVVFFDCHVAPQLGWHEPFLQLIGQNYRRLVVPQITALDIDTWTQVSQGGGLAKCYLTWDADFKWFDSDNMYVAVISGGLVGMSRRWWHETRGYDEHMHGWGGENVDQSLRVWLCGGEIVSAKGSFVAHMWRTADRRTRVHYWRVGDSARNRARAVHAWYGDFSEKLADFPGIDRRRWLPWYWLSQPWYGDIGNMLAVKRRLKCRPFAWFLRRFKAIYEDAGILAKEVFMLREEESGQCLRYEGYAGTSADGTGHASLSSCWPESDHRLFWHAANRNHRGSCCSGIRAWNTDQCLMEVARSRFKTAVCDIAGNDVRQHWEATRGGELRSGGGGSCVAAARGRLATRPCEQLRGASAAAEGGGARWTRAAGFVPLETRLYAAARRDRPDLLASAERQFADLAAEAALGGVAGEAGRGGGPCGATEGGCFTLRDKAGVLGCLDESTAFTKDANVSCATFYLRGGELRNVRLAGQCLDMLADYDAHTWGMFPCHGGQNQQFKKNVSGTTFCDVADECLAYA